MIMNVNSLKRTDSRRRQLMSSKVNLRRSIVSGITASSLALGSIAPAWAQTTPAATPDGSDASAAGETPAEAQPPVQIDPVEACLSEHTDGQALRNQGKLLESREAFRSCSQNHCPAAVRRDCLAWSDELRTQIPTMTFRVTLDGKTTTDAKVYLDGDLLDKAMDGRAVELNPGIYRLRFELGDFPPLEQELIASEGERYRVVTGAFQNPEAEVAAAPPPPVVTAPLSPPKLDDVERPIPIVTYVFLGLGAVGAISAGAWGLSTMVTKNDLEATCSPNCSDNKISAVEQRALLTDISAGVGLLSFIIAGTTYFLRPTVNETPAVEFDAAAIGDDGMMGIVRFNAF